MAGGTFFQFKHFAGATAGTVVAGDSTQNVGGKQALLHTVVVNVAATSVSVYDASTTGDTSTPIALITTGTGTFIYDCEVQKGIMVVIVGASADVTVNYR
jgi:hypothetical protein